MNGYLVIDMSNDFVDDNGSLTAGKVAQDIEGAIIKRLNMFFERGDIIVFCMDSHIEDDPHFQLWAPHNIKGTWGSDLYGSLFEWYNERKDLKNVYFVEKSEYDAFYKTDLENILKQNCVENVYVSGVCTDICVFNTVYGAYKAGFKTFVAADECATFTQNQKIFLDHMNTIYKTEIIN